MARSENRSAVSPELRRTIGLPESILLGLGSILGTGIFVSLGLAAGITGPSVIVAIALAALVAACNALSSAQLAAAHPVSGGTYEYGYQYLRPWAGFLAGWTFLLAKSASAATAALGCAGYGLTALGVPGIPLAPIALLTVLAVTGIVWLGLRRSSQVNTAIVSITLLSLAAFAAAGFWHRYTGGAAVPLKPFFEGDQPGEALQNLLHATALMFVAYTGYGRIATLAEEVSDPRRTIPRAIIATLAISGLVYLAVAVAGIGSVGPRFLSEAAETQAAPLEMAAKTFGVPLLPGMLALGAATAMLGVLLNLILGLSRVLLAMGRRGDMPRTLARLDPGGRTPAAAVIAVGVFIAGLTLLGSVRTTWSFSAFTVLVYYAVTNAAALALPRPQQRYPRWIAAAGLAACLLLSVQIETRVWAAGLAILAAGLLWHTVARRRLRLRA